MAACEPADMAMDYVNLGKSGVKVSRLCLGTMTYEVTGRVARITLNRPERLNAIRTELEEFLRAEGVAV